MWEKMKILIITETPFLFTFPKSFFLNENQKHRPTVHNQRTESPVKLNCSHATNLSVSFHVHHCLKYGNTAMNKLEKKKNAQASSTYRNYSHSVDVVI